MLKYLSLFNDDELKEDTSKPIVKVEYNESQLNFINTKLENGKLLGIPGGGKTQSIIGKVINHFFTNEFNKTTNFLILTFSRRACNDFIEKGRRQNSIYFNTRNVRTLHSLAGKIVYNILNKRAESQDTVIISATEIITKKNMLKMEEFTNLKIIFIDEAQDISDIQYNFIMKISELLKCYVILIGDPNQNIYQFQNGSDTYLLNHPGNTFSLIKNYRSTPHIVNFINEFRPWDSLTQKMVSTKSNEDILNKKPSIFIGSIEEIINDIKDKILKSTFSLEEIDIIGPDKK